MFFFEKKNQKTFIPRGSATGAAAPRERGKSSFSSEKEDSFAEDSFALVCLTFSRRAAA